MHHGQELEHRLSCGVKIYRSIMSPIMHKRLDMSWFARLRRAYPLKLFSDPELPPLAFFLNSHPSLKDLAIGEIEFKDTHCVRAQIIHA